MLKSLKIKFKEIILKDIFDFLSIKGLTQSFIHQNRGDISVYGSRIKEDPIGYVCDNIEGAKYFENCLAWNREGSVGYVFWHKHKFTTNDHHRPYCVVKVEHHKDIQYKSLDLKEIGQ